MALGNLHLSLHSTPEPDLDLKNHRLGGPDHPRRGVGLLELAWQSGADGFL